MFMREVILFTWTKGAHALLLIDEIIMRQKTAVSLVKSNGGGFYSNGDLNSS